MPKEAVFTMKLEPELRAAFMAAAAEVDRPASQLVRQMMREFVEHQQKEPGYDKWLLAKLEKGRAQARAGIGRPNKVVEAEFAARRAEILGPPKS
jgi:predicted transcriptional regulator